MPALTYGVAASLSPHQAGLDSGLGTTAWDADTALSVAARQQHPVRPRRPDLRPAPVALSAATPAVVAGYGGATQTRTIAKSRERVLSRLASR